MEAIILSLTIMLVAFLGIMFLIGRMYYELENRIKKLEMNFKSNKETQ